MTDFRTRLEEARTLADLPEWICYLLVSIPRLELQILPQRYVCLSRDICRCSGDLSLDAERSRDPCQVSAFRMVFSVMEIPGAADAKVYILKTPYKK
jgi:hypothetical protein